MPLLKKEYPKPSIGDTRYYAYARNYEPKQMTLMAVEVFDVGPVVMGSSGLTDVVVTDVIIDDNMTEVREPGAAFELQWVYLIDTPQNAKREFIEMFFKEKQ